MEPPKLAWYTELSNAVKQLTPPETVDQKAIRLLNEQLKQLEAVRGLNYRDPVFLGWRDTTSSLLQRFLPPGSPHTIRFINLAFHKREVYGLWESPPPSGYISPQNKEHYITECRTAESTIRAALKHVEEFGVHAEESPVKPGRGGVNQNFYGNVTIQNQAIATDSAIQNIGRMGDAMGPSLREIAEAFSQSEELTAREVKQGLAGIEGLAVEIQKPEVNRNWKTVLDYGQVVLTIADKATDLAHKLGPYLPAILTLMEKGRHFIK